ncbi:MAG: hypothetical protein IJU76_14340 [Desulfovibrionaceae bacterium]|nr:hypothetical protein [Desulfovibrionaceae bacterium]
MAITKESLRTLYQQYDRFAREEQSQAIRARNKAGKDTPDVFLHGRMIEQDRKNPKPVTMLIRERINIQNLVAAYATMGVNLEEGDAPSNPRRSSISPSSLTLSPQDLKKIAAHIRKRKRKFGVDLDDDTKSAEGIPYSQLLRTSSAADKERARNVRNATFYGRQGDIFNFRVTGNDKPYYRVQIQMHSWSRLSQNAAIPPLKAAQDMVNGRLSIECPCGRHQFWYRYLASIGDYAIEPEEHDFPKIRNPRLTGCCCKHVLKVLHVLKSNSFLVTLMHEIKLVREKNGSKGSTRAKVFGDETLRMAEAGRLTQVFAKQLKDAQNELKNLKARKPTKKQAQTKSKTQRQSPTLSDAVLTSIGDLLKSARTLGLDMNMMLNQIASKQGLTRQQLETVIKEHNL